MNDNVTALYWKKIEMLKTISSPLCKKLKINIDIEVPSRDEINAKVIRKGDRTYLIQLYPGCFNLSNKISELTSRYSKDDAYLFRRVVESGIMEHSSKPYEDDTFRDTINDLFGTMILLHFFFHEIAHIEAGHVGELAFEYLEYDSGTVGDFEKQEREMYADWNATKYVFDHVLFAVILKNRGKDERDVIVKNFTMIYWLTLMIEYQIFELKPVWQSTNYRGLDHPHPVVRLYYSFDALQEAVADSYILLFGFDVKEGDEKAYSIIKELRTVLQSFIGITEIPIKTELARKDIIDCYLQLRDLSYRKLEAEGKNHLVKIPDEYVRDLDLLIDNIDILASFFN